MLEKECFVQEQDPSHVATEQSHLEQIQVTEKVELITTQKQTPVPTEEHSDLLNLTPSPHKRSKEDIVQELISASPGSAQRTEKLDSLEAQLMTLIREQEAEVNKLREENERVLAIQTELQNQIATVNKESLEMENHK